MEHFIIGEGDKAGNGISSSGPVCIYSLYKALSCLQGLLYIMAQVGRFLSVKEPGREMLLEINLKCNVR